MKIEEYKVLEMRAHEAFIRRASEIDSPFMLKGSYVTRQYFYNANDRIPADLDWIFLNKINDEKSARGIFNNWAKEVTELELNDGVKFRSFSENEFWRRIDYAMADDFPTVNTDLKCWVDGKELNFSLDVSFNLNIDYPPVSLTYRPLSGEPFSIQNTVPLSLQVSWKIHQTLVRPRFKDLFDLIHLVQHPHFDTNTLALSKQALINECKADNVGLDKLSYFFNYEIEKLFPNDSIDETWDYWRHNINNHNYDGSILYFDKAENLTNANRLPINLSVFLTEFKNVLLSKGLTINLINDLFIPIEKIEINTNLKEVQPSESNNTVKLTRQKINIWDRIKRLFK